MLVWLPLLTACDPVLEGPTPTIASVSPAIVCTDAGQVDVTAMGSNFAPLVTSALVDPALEVPDATLALATAFAPDAGVGGVSDPPETWSSGSSVTFTVGPELTLEPGLYDVVVTNVDGAAATLPEGFAVLPPPSVEAITPSAVCAGSGTVDVVVTGSWFLVIDGQYPTLTLGADVFTATSADGCDALQIGTAQLCTSLVVPVPTDAVSAVTVGVVTNPPPADCASSEAVSFEIGPGPTLASAAPEVACDPNTAVTLTGDGLLDTASIEVDGQPYLDFVVSTDDTIDLVAPAGGWAAGIHTVTVIGATGCVSAAVDFEILAPPSVTSAALADVCDAASTLALIGTGFGAGLTVQVDGLDAPTTVVNGTLATADVSGLGLAPGLHSAAVVTADGCASAPVVFEVGAAPTLSASTPDAACDPDTAVALSGDGFADGGFVTIEVDGQPYPDFVVATDESIDLLAPIGGWSVGAHDVTVLSAAGCASDTVEFEIVEPPSVDSAALADVCDASTALTVTGTGFVAGLTVQVDGFDVPTTVVNGALATADVSGLGLATGLHTVVVSAGGCASAPVTFEVAGTPTIDTVAPTSGCDGVETLSLTGTGFVAGSTVTVGGVPADATDVLSSTSIEADLGPTGLPAGEYDVTVTSPQGCTATAVSAYEILPTPALYGVSPSALYTGVEIDVVLYTEGLTGPVTRVAVRPVLGGPDTDLVFDDTDLEQIVATVPAGLDPGAYDVIVEQGGSCPAVLYGGLTVQGTLTIDIGGISPPALFQEGRTTVTITASDPPDLGEVQFQDVPQVFLVPTDPGDVLIELVQVTFVSPTELTVFVRGGYPPGVYDVLVVNPDGSVGLYPAGVEILIDPPPTISSLSPASIPASGSQTITLTGFNFDSPTVKLWCRDPVTHVEVEVDAPVLSSSLFSVSASVPTGSTGEAPCVVRVTNMDGQSGDFIGLSVTDPAQAMFDWRDGPDLNVARRAPAATIGRPRSDARVLYVIGGDDGAPGGALDSIEVSRLDLWGDPGPFDTLETGLPAPRTLAGVARIDKFLYLIGGNDGAGPVDTVWRAQVLDPAAAPLFDFLALDYGAGDALAAGTYLYRVSALFDPLDPYNAGGESLACDPIVVRVPDADPTTVVTVAWGEVFGAIGYRVYRTPFADSGSGTEEWLVDLLGASSVVYADHGDATDGSKHPLSLGALGEWTELPALPTPVQAPSVVAAPDPFDSSSFYVYAAGGYDGTVLRDEVHSLDVFVWDEFSQDAGSWLPVSFDLPAAVHEGGAWVVDRSLHTVVAATEVYVYFGGGRTTLGPTTTGSVVFGEVQPGGDLDGLTAASALLPARAGFSTASSAGFLYGFGGASAAPSADGSSTTVLAGGSLGGWGAGPPAPSVARYLAGSAQERAVFFLIGGDNGSGATTSTEVTNF